MTTKLQWRPHVKAISPDNLRCEKIQMHKRFLLSFDCNHFGHIPHASGCGQVFAVLLNEHSVTLGHMLLKVATGASIYKAPADVL